MLNISKVEGEEITVEGVKEAIRNLRNKAAETDGR
jgi:hypothetical protein